MMFRSDIATEVENAPLPQSLSKGESKQLEITSHSWYGKRCHLVRSNGTVVRAVVKEVVFAPHHFGLRCCYFTGSTKRSKTVSPLALLWVQLMWDTSEILSDAATTEESSELQLAVAADVPCSDGLAYTRLEMDEIEMLRLSSSQVRSVRWQISETSIMQDLHLQQM